MLNKKKIKIFHTILFAIELTEHTKRIKFKVMQMQEVFFNCL